MRARLEFTPRSRALVLLMMFQSTMHIGTTVGLNVALPQMVEDFDADVGIVVWVQVAYGVGLIGTALPLGLLISHFEPRRVIVFSQAFELVVCMMIALMPNVYGVIVLRVLQASVRSLPWLSLQMLSIGEFPPEQRGRVLAITTFAVGAAMLASPPLVGLVTDRWDWRWVFVGTGLVMGLIGVLALLWLRPSGVKRPPVWERLAGFDLFGSLLLMAGAVGLIVALQLTIRASLAVGLGVAAVSLMALAATVRVEMRHPDPVIPFRLFRIPGVFLGASQAVMMGWVTGAFLLILPFLFINGYGWSAAYAGSIFFFVNAARPPGNLVSGWLSDRMGSTAIVIPAAACIVASQLFVAALGVSPWLVLVIVGILIVGFAQGIGQTANLRQMYASVPQEKLRLAPGLNLVLMSLGSTTAQAVVASTIAAATVNVGSGGSPDLVSAASRAIVMTTVVFGVGIAVSQLWPRLAMRRDTADEDVEGKPGSSI